MSEVKFLNNNYKADFAELKKDLVAAHLVGLLAHSKVSRAELGAKLNWNKSRVSKVLSGNENLTLKTIFAVTSALGYDFDVVFFNKKYSRPKQPWQIDREKLKNETLIFNKPDQNAPTIELSLQTFDEVNRDILDGIKKPFYISLSDDNKRVIKNVQKDDVSVDFKNNKQISLNERYIPLRDLMCNMDTV